MRFKIWGNGPGLRPARRLNREDVESVVIGALDGSVTGPAPDLSRRRLLRLGLVVAVLAILSGGAWAGRHRSEEHTSELQSQSNLVCRLLLEKKTNTLLLT